MRELCQSDNKPEDGVLLSLLRINPVLQFIVYHKIPNQKSVLMKKERHSRKAVPFSYIQLAAYAVSTS